MWDGIDICNFSPEELRKHMGTIFQDFSRYDLTIQQNIGVGDVGHIENEEIVQQAAIKAGIHERVIKLPRGYKSFLGRWLDSNQDAVDFSGGEWQKIALSRMFMRKTDLLILDEPTASLDAEAEYELYTQFRELMRGQTSLLISHRFSTVQMADNIAVLVDGEIAEYGSHDELLLLDGTYSRLYQMQAEQYK